MDQSSFVEIVLVDKRKTPRIVMIGAIDKTASSQRIRITVNAVLAAHYYAPSFLAAVIQPIRMLSGVRFSTTLS